MHTKFRLFLLALGAIALIAAGCGDEEDSGDSGTGGGGGEASAQALTITVTGPDEFEAPGSAETGLTEISLQNDSDRPANVQLVRVVGDHSAEEVATAIKSAMRAGPLPEWFLLGGGTSEAAPGESVTVTQVLQPGTYYAVGRAPDSGVPITVEGEESSEEIPAGTATVTAEDYSFETEGLRKGVNQVVFENAGEQPHHLLAFPLAEGKTIQDVREFAEGPGQGPPPVDEASGAETAILEGGDSQLVELELKKSGTYALLCFIADRQGGPPHVAKGMIGTVQIP